MIRKISFVVFLAVAITQNVFSQEVLNAMLLKADKLYIGRQYQEAVLVYLKYLEKYPRDYYAERQTAVCYDRLNKPDDAIDHWPIVVESSDATEKDYLEYGKSLLANNRGPEAKKIFMVLSRSTDKSLAAWGKMYLNPLTLFIDSASTKVMEVKGINTPLPEYSPVFYKDKMFYVSDNQLSLRSFYPLNDILTQTPAGALRKDSVSLFPTLIFEKLHSMNISGPFCFSPDGAYFYFCKAVSNDELKIKSDQVFYRYQIYTLTMSTLNNVAPEIKKFKYNSPDYDFMHPALSRDGKHLFFSSNMKGSMGGKDIFMCEWTTNGWSVPKNLGSQVNSPGNEVFPHVAEDLTLYFSSDHRPGLGGLDIFSAKLSTTKDKLFEECENAGAKMNSRFDDFGVYIFKGGNKGYLSSNRKNNTDDDIYFFTKKADK